MKFIVLARKSKMSAASFPSAGKLGLTIRRFPRNFLIRNRIIEGFPGIAVAQVFLRTLDAAEMKRDVEIQKTIIIKEPAISRLLFVGSMGSIAGYCRFSAHPGNRVASFEEIASGM